MFVFRLRRDFQRASEAMAIGLPVISTDCRSGIADVHSGSGNGLLVPCGDPDALAEAMERLAADPEMAQRLGRRLQDSERLIRKALLRKDGSSR